MTYGEMYVTQRGVQLMPLWCADNSDTHPQVQYVNIMYFIAKAKIKE